ncbi:hypothetical protein J2755_000261 [Methanohalophilus levihalophilus]|uniref:hypothetical protein n=1 Tax=Methanohalophilus levihalophilus TaxID=1431282 RepID=UPI001AE6AD07|nr:hypothetical protein [Methanohalophilus levihalophilus]MBP2029341.1 hypothetical protein [Methanohalophilus levihalophilus]
MDSQTSHLSKDLGKYRVEVNTDPEKGGHLMIWVKPDEHNLNVFIRSDDMEWDCASARMFSSAEEAEKAYGKIVSEEQIDHMLLSCGFGKKCF